MKRVMRPACVVAVVVTGIVATAGQIDRAQNDALARRASDRLQALQRESERLDAAERTVLGDIRKLEIERQLKAEELLAIDSDVAAVQADLQLATTRIAGLAQSEQAQRPELRARMVEVYKLGRARYVRLFFANADVRRIGQAARTVAAMAAMDRQRIATHTRTMDDLASERRTLEERARRLTALRDDAARAQRAAARAVQARDEMRRDIDTKRDVNTQLASELQAAQQKLQTAMRELPAVATPPAPGLPLSTYRGDVAWPTAGVVRRPFAPTAQPPSNGIEIETLGGLAVTSVHDGTVAFAGLFTGFGNLVIVEHEPQTFSLYGDLLQIAVRKGDHVDRGQRVGSVGATPSGASGLYFELRIDGQPVDPLQWLKKR